MARKGLPCGMWILGTLPLKLRADIHLTQETMTVDAHIEGMAVVPSHELFLACIFERFAQCNRVVDDVGNDAYFKPLDG